MEIKAVNETHIREMKHCIGLDYKRPKRGKYEAYRNYCCCYKSDPVWEHLVKVGYAECCIEERENSIPPKMYLYHLTKDGLNFMGTIMGCTVTLRN